MFYDMHFECTKKCKLEKIGSKKVKTFFTPLTALIITFQVTKVVQLYI